MSEIPAGAWMPIAYPLALWDDQLGCGADGTAEGFDVEVPALADGRPRSARKTLVAQKLIPGEGF